MYHEQSLACVIDGEREDFSFKWYSHDNSSHEFRPIVFDKQGRVIIGNLAMSTDEEARIIPANKQNYKCDNRKENHYPIIISDIDNSLPVFRCPDNIPNCVILVD